jgi:hypothetical protein
MSNMLIVAVVKFNNTESNCVRKFKDFNYSNIAPNCVERLALKLRISRVPFDNRLIAYLIGASALYCQNTHFISAACTSAFHFY